MAWTFGVVGAEMERARVCLAVVLVLGLMGSTNKVCTVCRVGS